MILLASVHFASFFLGLEVLSVSLYGLIAYPRRRPQAVEAAFKYLVLAGTTSAFLLFGMALVYAVTGTMLLRGSVRGRPGALRLGERLLSGRTGADLRRRRLQAGARSLPPLDPRRLPGRAGAGDGLPGHRLEGGGVRRAAPVRRAARSAPWRGPLRRLHHRRPMRPCSPAISWPCFQQNVKRLLAYSSIAQLGYLTVALIASGAAGQGGGGLLSVGLRARPGGRLRGRRHPLATTTASRSPSRSTGGLGHRQAGAGAGPHREHAFACRDAAHRRLHRQVLHLQGGSRGFALGAADRSRSHQRHEPLLLPAGGRSPCIGSTRRLSRLVSQRPAERAGAICSAVVDVALLSVLTVVLGVYPTPLLRLIEQVTAALG